MQGCGNADGEHALSAGCAGALSRLWWEAFKPEVLAVRYKGYDISEILDLTIEEALAVFQECPRWLRALSLMSEVGLGYLQLGQPANTLSGAKRSVSSWRKRLARRTRNGRTLYLLDEPTTGLHPADVARLP